MSSELRKLIIGSIQQYHEFIKQFKQDKYLTAKEIFDSQFNPETIFQKSFIEVELKESSTGDKFTFSDELTELHTTLTNVIKDIIECSKGVERPDNMFIKNAEKHSNLWEVPFEDQEVTEMFNEIDTIIGENLEVIAQVTDLYQPFEFVMKDKEEIEKFIAASPKREDFKKRIQTYEEKKKIIRYNA